jgi:predicted PurR-regulated permease PerM
MSGANCSLAHVSGFTPSGSLHSSVPDMEWRAIAGVLNAIPYVDDLGLLLATGFTLAGGGGWWHVAGVQVPRGRPSKGYLITPRILGTRLNLHPMAVILGLLIGQSFCLLGVILVIPTIAVTKVFHVLSRLPQGFELHHNSA